MGKIGTYEYPDHTFSKCKDVTKIIVENGITSAESLLPKLSEVGFRWHKPHGAYSNLITTLKRFGLLEGTAERFKHTNLAERLIKPKPGEFNEVASESIMKIELLKRLYDRIGSDENKLKNDFWVHLHEITGADRTTAQKHEKAIRKLYIDALQYLKEGKKVSNMDTDKDENEGEQQYGDVPPKTKQLQQVPEGVDEIKVGNIRIWLPEDDKQKEWDKVKKIVDIYLDVDGDDA